MPARRADVGSQSHFMRTRPNEDESWEESLSLVDNLLSCRAFKANANDSICVLTHPYLFTAPPILDRPSLESDAQARRLSVRGRRGRRGRHSAVGYALGWARPIIRNAFTF